MKNILKNQEYRLNEILFQGRNKEYGAYVLRNESNSILTKSMVIGVSLLVAIATTPLVVNSFKDEVPISKKDGVIANLDHIYDQQKDKPVEKPKPVEEKQIQKQVKTYDNRVANPTRNADETKLPDEADKKNAAAGIQTNNGEEVTDPNTVVTIIKAFPTGNIKTGGDEIIEKPKEKIKDPNEIVPKVDVNADFIGGINSFRSKVLNAIDGSGFEDSGDVIRTEVTFVVEKDGSITNLKANGKDISFNKEAIRAIKAVKGKWKPAQVNGEAVRSYFKFPLSMKFD